MSFTTGDNRCNVRERVRFIWASNTAGVIAMLFSVKSLGCAKPVTEDAQEAPTVSPGREARETSFMWRQDVRKSMID